MSFTYTDGATAGGNSTSADTGVHGIEINVGDLVVFFVNSNSSTPPSVDSDTGATWTTEFAEKPTSETASHGLAWKVADGSEPTSYSWTTGSAAWQCILKVFSAHRAFTVDSVAATDFASVTSNEEINMEAQSGKTIAAGGLSIITGAKDNRFGTPRDYVTLDESYVSPVGNNQDQGCVMAHRIGGFPRFPIMDSVCPRTPELSGPEDCATRHSCRGTTGLDLSPARGPLAFPQPSGSLDHLRQFVLAGGPGPW